MPGFLTFQGRIQTPGVEENAGRLAALGFLEDFTESLGKSFSSGNPHNRYRQTLPKAFKPRKQAGRCCCSLGFPTSCLSSPWGDVDVH
jgi:hypothetical protein